MTATASVSSPWMPEDDLLLKNSIESGASLEALAKGAVNFSRRFTLRELRDRWYSLLYDPDVSAQASVHMAELEQSVSNPSSKFNKLENNLKGNEKVNGKRKSGSIRRQYYAMRKRIKSEFFSSPNLGFFEEHKFQDHNYNQQQHNVRTNHEAPGGDAMLGDCLAHNLGFEETDFEILRQAFPESIGGISNTETANPTDFINETMREEDGLYKFPEDVSFDPNKNSEIPKDDLEKPEDEKAFKTDKAESKLGLTNDLCSGFGGKHHFNSPVSDGSASFHTMGFSSPSTRLPLWKTLEDVSAPDMPVDENNAESQQVLEETENCIENKNSSLPNNVHEGEYTDLPDSLLNFSNDDDLLFIDVDPKDPPLLNSPKEVDLCNLEVTTSPEESKDFSFHSDQHDESLQLTVTGGKIICTLNREDPDIPCNDDIFLLIHPSVPYGPSVGPLMATTDSIDPLSSSSHEKDCELGGLSILRKGKEAAPCFPRSRTVGSNPLSEFVSSHPLVGSAFKRESADVGKSNNLGISIQARGMSTGLEGSGNGMMEEDSSKVELRGLDSEMPLPVEVGSTKIMDQESVDNSYVSDQDKSDSDGDIPYFSDVEAMILEMDLAHTQESSEAAKYQYEKSKKMIIRLEQAARSSFQRTMSSHGAFAIFYGRRLKHYIKKTEVTIGRSTDDTQVDIDLRKEGRANKISRRQAIIKMEADGTFNLKNLGSSSISLNGKEVAHGKVVALASSCLIEIRGMSFVFETNEKYVKRFLDSQRR